MRFLRRIEQKVQLVSCRPGLFVAAAMRRFQLQRERGDAVAQLGILARECLGFDLIPQAQVE